MNNKQIRDKYLEDNIDNKRTHLSTKTALNILLNIRGENPRGRSQASKQFTNFKTNGKDKKSIISIEKRDIIDFFNFLNKDSETWSLSSKKQMFSFVKKFILWILNYFEKELLNGLQGIDQLNKRLEIMEIKDYLNNRNNFEWKKSHKFPDSNAEVVLTIDEIKKIIAYFKEYKWTFYITYRLLIETGMRVRELTSIVLDYKENSHSIPIEDDLEKRMIRVKWIKTSEIKPYKTYFISEPFQKELLAYVRDRREITIDDNHLFLSVYHNPMNVSNIYDTLKRYTKKLGFKKSISPHVFRHTLNTLRMKEPINCPEDVREFLLKHGKGQINQQYVNLTDLEKRDLFDKYNPYKDQF